MNEFQNDLAWSLSQSEQPWWEAVYRQAFPLFQAMHAIKDDGWAQRGGIDRKVMLTDGTVLKIDEKCRRTVYRDFALEIWSNYERRVPGWIVKPLTCDFIAYAFVPIRTCYLLPYQLLRAAWERFGEDWLARHGSIAARNPGYTTVSCPVPINEVLAAIVRCMVITWPAASCSAGEMRPEQCAVAEVFPSPRGLRQGSLFGEPDTASW